MSAPPVAVAIDQGTTSTRALRLDADGRCQVVHAVAHEQIYPQPGWVEHDPEELLRNLVACLEAPGPAPAIAIANQGESCLAWDAQTKRPLSRVLVWQDSRTQPQIEAMKAAGHAPTVLARTGLPLDSYFSASKLAWLFASLPEAETLLAQGRLRLGTTDAFFLDRLTGRCVTDVTTASRTALMNLSTMSWDAELCRLFGVPMEALPEIVSTTGDFGGVTVGGRACPVTASLVDQQAALYGHGCRAPGAAKVTFGTGAFVLSVTGPEALHASEVKLSPTLAWRKAGQPPVYALDGAVYCASAAVNWARGLGLFEHFAQIESFARPPAISRGLAFVPALAGLAAPHWDRAARGTWLGLGLDTEAGDLVQALLEGIALRTAEVIAAMDRVTPVTQALSVDGGLSANPYFLQFLADVTERPVVYRTQPELTALGAALLAAEHNGATVALPEQAVHYTPRGAPAAWRERFAQAVALARTWGETAPQEAAGASSGL